jgi:uncharacterized protein
MHGYQLTFFTQQSRKHNGLPLGEWLLQEARKLGIRGATLTTATQGFGHDGKLHSAHFFELSDQPIEVIMALSETDAERMFARLHEEKINVFFVKTPIEYGMSGES